MNDYQIEIDDHVDEYFEKEILKFKHSQNAYIKSVDLAELLLIEPEFYHDFAELLKEIILNVIVERIIHLDIVKDQLNDAFIDIDLEYNEEDLEAGLERMGINKKLGNP